MTSEQIETSPELWAAVWQLADVWSATPVVEEFASALPRRHLLKPVAKETNGVPELLKELTVSAGGLMHTPLMFGTRIPAILREPLFARSDRIEIDDVALNNWLQCAIKVEHAFRQTLGWLRSSLYGYPILRAPQLAPGTPLTTFELTNEFIWTKEERRSGLNQHLAPPSVPELLGADGPTRIALADAARQVAVRLQQSSTWNQFNISAKALTGDAKVVLRGAQRQLAKKLSSEKLNEYEETLAIPRSEFRAHEMTEVVEKLSGPARTYADTFGKVHALLRLTMCEVFGELAVFGEPWPIPATNLNTSEPGQPVVEFQSTPAAGVLVSPGQVVWLKNDSVPDAVRINGISLKFDLAQDGNDDEFIATVLLGTSEAWPEHRT